MKLNKLLFKNLQGNFVFYKVHFFTLSAIIAIYYNFVTLKYNQGVIELQAMSDALEGSGTLTATVVYIFMVFFIWYSSTYFLKQRMKELGMYTLMGISIEKTALLYVLEYILLGFLAIVLGVGVGIIMNRLFFMFIAKVSLHHMDIPFFIGWQSIAHTILGFGVLTILIGMKDYFKIMRSNIIDLLKGKDKEEYIPKSKIKTLVTGFLGLIVLIAGYVLSFMAVGNMSRFNEYALLTIIFCCLGSFLFFRATVVLLIQYLNKFDNIRYKKTHALLLSQLSHGIKRNYSMFAILSILIGSTVTIISTVFSMSHAVKTQDRNSFPYTLTYVVDEMGQQEIMDKELETVGILPGEKVSVPIFGMENVNFGRYTDDLAFLTVSQCQALLKLSGYDKDFNPELSHSQGILVKKAIVTMFDQETLDVDGIAIEIIDNLPLPLIGSIYKGHFLIVDDGTYEKLTDSLTPQYFTAIETFDEKAIEYEAFKELVKGTIADKEISIMSRIIYQEEKSTYRIMGLTYFVGSVIALVFLVATGSILYFKVMTDGFSEQEKWQTLKSIGMTNKELLSVARKQVALYFFSPVLLAFCHSFFAIRALQEIMGIHIEMQFIMGVGSFLLIYILYYLLSIKEYKKYVDIWS